MLECGDGEEILCLPVLGQEYTPRTLLATYQFLVMTKANVREKLKQYRRPVSGNQEEVLQCLRAFSEEENEWLRYAASKLYREHTSRKTLSQKQVKDTFGAVPPTLTYKSKKSADHTQRSLSEKDRTANTSWATAVFSAFRMPTDFSCVLALPKHRQTQIEPAQQTPEVPVDSELTGCGSLHEQELFAMRMRRVENNIESVRDDIYNIKGSINNVTAHVMDVKSLVSCSALPPICKNHVPHQAQPMGQSACTTTAVLPLSSQPVSSPHSDFGTVPQQSIPSAKLGVALLGDEWFEYDKTRVPELPTIHLSKDIDRLCKEWESSSLLHVGGCGIPVKYWGEFYKRAKGAKTTAWDALRVEWGNWKFIAEERQCYPDTASFWCAFSNGNSKKFSYQQILNCIAEQQTAAAAQDANNAHIFFGGNLDHSLAQGAFCYAKGSKTYLLHKAHNTARHLKCSILLSVVLSIFNFFCLHRNFYSTPES
ncbi:hypothetical protein F4604DRAFT_1929109 [Suillus subluteus]|nr:hypothetical protein F4604DRAFT_1929109 [Suillus subluteus]